MALNKRLYPNTYIYLLKKVIEAIETIGTIKACLTPNFQKEKVYMIV